MKQEYFTCLFNRLGLVQLGVSSPKPTNSPVAQDTHSGVDFHLRDSLSLLELRENLRNNIFMSADLQDVLE